MHISVAMFGFICSFIRLFFHPFVHLFIHSLYKTSLILINLSILDFSYFIQDDAQRSLQLADDDIKHSQEQIEKFRNEALALRVSI